MKRDTMAETLSLQESQVRYNGEWGLIGDPEVDASLKRLSSGED